MKVLPLYTGVFLHRHAVNDYFRSKRGMALVGCWLAFVFTICEMNRLTFTYVRYYSVKILGFIFLWWDTQNVLSAVDLKLIKSNLKKNLYCL